MESAAPFLLARLCRRNAMRVPRSGPTSSDRAKRAVRLPPPRRAKRAVHPCTRRRINLEVSARCQTLRFCDIESRGALSRGVVRPHPTASASAWFHVPTAYVCGRHIAPKGRTSCPQDIWGGFSRALSFLATAAPNPDAVFKVRFLSLCGRPLLTATTPIPRDQS